LLSQPEAAEETELWRGESWSRRVPSPALLPARALVSQALSSPAVLRMTESATLLAAAMRQPPLVDERRSLREKRSASEAHWQASLSRWFERRDQVRADWGRLTAQVANSRAHAKALNSLTHVEALNSTALRSGGCSLFCRRSPSMVTISRGWPRGPVSPWIGRWLQARSSAHSRRSVAEPLAPPNLQVAQPLR
jgi:hypothetical protein